MEHASDEELLFSSGVLTVTDDGVSLSPQFEFTIGGYRETVADLPKNELSRLIRERVDEESLVAPLVELAERDSRTGAELCALRDHVHGSTDEWLPLLPVLRLFRDETVPTDGVPDGFVPVPGDQLPHLAKIYSRLLVYVWLDDCEPCDALKRRLESIFERPRGMLSVAVYGPDHRESLAREYDVTAGPALLFVRDGSVDTRLYGAHSERVVETEIETLVE